MKTVPSLLHVRARARLAAFALLMGIAAWRPAGSVGAQQSVQPSLPTSSSPSNLSEQDESFYRERAFPDTRISPGALISARAAAERSSSRAGAAGASSWTSIGPAPIHDPFLGTVSGRVESIAIDPTNSNVIYLGAAEGGVWKTTNGGTTWVPVTDREASLAMGALAIDPSDHNVIYAATGEAGFVGDAYYGVGVLKSADGGQTWTLLASSALAGCRVRRIAIDPSHTSTLFLAAVNSPVRSPASCAGGIYRSADTGADWTRLVDLPGQGWDLIIDPATPSVLYATTFQNLQQGAIWKTTDGGDHWTNVYELPTNRSATLAIAPSNSQIVYAGITALFGQASDVYRTTDGGANWTRQGDGLVYCHLQCAYDNVLAADPHDADTVYLGGVLLVKCTNGGASCVELNAHETGTHFDQHALVFDSSGRLFVGNDGGVWRTDDGGGSFVNLNDGLAISQFYPGTSGTVAPPTEFVGGTQDNGTVRYTGSTLWDEIIPGDGGYTAIDPGNPALMYGWVPLGGSDHRLWRSKDSGRSFQILGSISDPSECSNAFPNPLVMYLPRPDVLYYAAGRLYRSSDGGSQWTAISPELSGNVAGECGISTIGPAYSDSNVIYVGTATGRLQVTVDGGLNWTDTQPNGLPLRYVTRVLVNPIDASEAFVTLSGFDPNGGAGHVFHTTDRGASWTNVTGDLPNTPVNAIAADRRTRPITLYVGTDVGVFRTTDGGTTWENFNQQSLPNVVVMDLLIDTRANKLIAATHGRSAWELDLPTVPLLLGDVNCDGTSNAIDAALMLEYSAGLLFLLDCQQNADVNHDGQVNSLDAALILQYSAGLISRLPP